jgi:Calcineurin-like phosphoesterase
VLLAQLSDPHLTTGVLAARPAERAHQALARVRALQPRPDCLVITGDLADNGQAAEYEATLALLERLDPPVHVVPGNHDHAPRLLHALAAVLEGHRPPTRILTGHLHRPSAAMFAGALVTSAPSTYRQVLLDLDPARPLAFVDEPPGLLLHHLRGPAAVTHLLPIGHAGPPLGTI